MSALRVRASFATATRVYTVGELVDSNDPVVRGKEALFEVPDDAVAARVEQATAAPGEVRNVAKRVAKAAKKVAG